MLDTVYFDPSADEMESLGAWSCGSAVASGVAIVLAGLGAGWILAAMDLDLLLP